MGASRYHSFIRLSEAEGNRSLITISCNFCRTKRHYMPGDLRKLLGDIEADRVARGSPCEVCGRKDYLMVRVWSPLPQERFGLVVRRLDRIIMLRRALWREEPIG